jgi:DDE superfamily endonuclease
MATWKCPQQWSEWGEWLAAGLQGRCRWRLPVLLFGILFAKGRRTAASWLRAAWVTTDFSDYYYFISAVGRKSISLATRLLVLLLRRLPSGPSVLLALDDTPTQRYGPKVQGAGIHHNPTPGPADAKFLYGHIWVTLAWVVRHPLWGTIGLPLRAMLYIRQKDIAKLPPELGWKFHTKLQQGAALVFWAWQIVAAAGKRLRVVADGAYAKRPFLKPLRTLGVVVVSRLRKDAALRDLPPKLKKGQRRGRGRPRTYGKHRISLAKRAAAKRGWKTIECVLYGETVTKQYKTFQATYRPACGMIRVVLVQEADGCEFFFSTDPDAGVQEILEAFADRSAIEQVFHDVKEVWGAGKQQLRCLWANIGAYHLNLWMHSLVELWAWNQSKARLCDRRDSPWDDAERRPSHADRRKALQRTILEAEYLSLPRRGGVARKIAAFARQVLKLAL